MNNNTPNKAKYIKPNFFKKVWYSITKFEKYPEMAALGAKQAIIYFSELMIIFSIIFTVAYVYYVSNVAEYEEKDLNFSQKMASQLIDKSTYNAGQIEEITEMLNENMGPSIALAMGISCFIAFSLSTLLDVFTLSVFGLLTCIIAKIKINYKAVFNMSIYALTLSTILKIIYMVIRLLTNYEIKYFEIMYIAVAYISLASAIFMIKSDVIKQQIELMKIIEEHKDSYEETIKIPPKSRNDKEEKKEKEDSNEEKQEENETEGQGSNA